MIQAIIVFGDPSKNILSKLTQYFTGCTAYHTGFLDTETGMFYDMWLQRRRRKWPQYQDERVLKFEMPMMTADFLESKMSNDTNTYGFMDYIMFGLRPIFHLFGKKTKNLSGLICSEMVNSDIRESGGNTPFDNEQEVPSPCDLYRWMMLEHKMVT